MLTPGFYSNGTEVYTELGICDRNKTHVPLYVGRAPTHVLIGHPVVAVGPGADDLFVQVTRLRVTATQRAIWHIEINNPMDEPVIVKLHSSFPSVVLSDGNRVHTVEGGGRLVVQ